MVIKRLTNQVRNAHSDHILSRYSLGTLLALCWCTVGTMDWLVHVRAYAREGKGGEKGRGDTDDDDERQDTQPEAKIFALWGCQAAAVKTSAAF